MKMYARHSINLFGLLILNLFIGIICNRAFGKAASLTSSSDDQSGSGDGTLTVPEGIYLYPKVLKQVTTVPNEHTSSMPCFVDSVVFSSSNGLRTKNKPQLFGVRWGKPAFEPTTAPATVSTTTPIVTSSPRYTSTELTSHTATQSTETTSNSSTAVRDKDFSFEYVASTQADITVSSAKRQHASESANPLASSTFEYVASTHPDITVTSAKRQHASESANPLASSTLNASSTEVIASTDRVTLSSSDVTVTSPASRYVHNSSSTLAVSAPSSTLVRATTATTNSTRTTTTHEGSSTAVPSNETWLDLVQLYDLDREKADHHFVTVQCRVNGTIQFQGFYVIEVEDINDNTPIFDQSSLTSLVPANLSFGDAAMYVRATDADIGLNAELQYTLVPGTEKVTFRSNKTTTSASDTFSVLQSGYVLAFGNLEPDTDYTFAVVVKDRGSRNDGNRATATATISVFKDFPPPSPTPLPTSMPTSLPTSMPTSLPTSMPTSLPTPSTANSSWMKYTFPIIGVFVILVIGVIVYLVRRRRPFRRRPILVIDDCTNLDNSELDHFGDHPNDNRHDDDVHFEDNDDVLIT